MAYSEDELLPLSALQHLVYCERQAALIHVEQVWDENLWTVEGDQLHEKVVQGERDTRHDIHIGRDLPLRSFRLGLVGRADVVEFHRVAGDQQGTELPPLRGRWCPFPVEYKRGRPKRHKADQVQLCGQALCLEEMFGLAIPAGALFYGQTRRRYDVRFTAELRELTERAASRFREIVLAGVTPTMTYDRQRCDECSLLDLCKPRVTGKDVRRYVVNALADQVENSR